MLNKHNKNSQLFPKLPLNQWESTKITLHLYLQIIGKIRLKLHPKLNHWWHATFYLSVSGLTTGPMPYNGQLLQIDFDFIKHVLLIETSQGGGGIEIPLYATSVAEFYDAVFCALKGLGIEINILAKPFDPASVFSDIPFAKDQHHTSYDRENVYKFWKILTLIYEPFEIFKGQFSGKSTPVHLYWHTFDFALTFFSGRRAPPVEGMDPVSKEAYSHEVISFGFWAGDKKIGGPAFYSYTYPEPKGLNNEKLLPAIAFWQPANGSSLAILKYEDMIKTDNPSETLLQFFESAYQAGSTLSRWEVS